MLMFQIAHAFRRSAKHAQFPNRATVELNRQLPFLRGLHLNQATIAIVPECLFFRSTCHASSLQSQIDQYGIEWTWIHPQLVQYLAAPLAVRCAISTKRLTGDNRSESIDQVVQRVFVID